MEIECYPCAIQSNETGNVDYGQREETAKKTWAGRTPDVQSLFK